MLLWQGWENGVTVIIIFKKIQRVHRWSWEKMRWLGWEQTLFDLYLDAATLPKEDEASILFHQVGSGACTSDSFSLSPLHNPIIIGDLDKSVQPVQLHIPS